MPIAASVQGAQTPNPGEVEAVVCPKCGQTQTPSDTCAFCGIVFRKAATTGSASAARPTSAAYATKSIEPRLAPWLVVGVVALALVASGTAWIAGYRWPADASIIALTPGFAASTGRRDFECWVTIELEAYPEGIDPKSLTLVLSSPALKETQLLDWAYLSERDVIDNSASLTNFLFNDATRPETVPPLGFPIRVRIPLSAQERVESSWFGQDLVLTAELFWGGKKQDRARRSLSRFYDANSR